MKHLEIIKSKLLKADNIDILLSVWRFKERNIVFTNGCFDILHLGHIDYLSKAADLGDKLIVGINSDASVKRLDKGAARPIQDEESRAILIAALHFTDAVIIFDEDTPYDLIKIIQPDVLVKGGDWKPEDIVGSDIVKAKGGSVTTIDYLPGYSTTDIERKIKSS